MDDIEKKYAARLKEELTGSLETRQYKEFKAEYLPHHLSIYERMARLSEKWIPISPDEKTAVKIKRAIEVCHLEMTPKGVYSFSVMAPFMFVLIVSILSFLLPVTLGMAFDQDWGGSLFILIFGVIGGLSLILPLQKLPFYLANTWRMKASNQMVLCVFYIVTYMRHTSNLELAIDFAAEHLAPPLSLDMKKVLWDIETEKHENIKESLDVYLEGWQEWNPEFIESVHLIQGSLVESSESRRVEMLDKSLNVMLQETYEKMLHYAHGLKTPLTTLHMLGIILPILGLVILPLMVNFIPEVKWFHMAIVYNVTLPALVYLLAKKILSTRPTGYGNADITDINPELKKYKDYTFRIGKMEIARLSPLAIALVLGIGVFIIGLVPLLYHISVPNEDWVYIEGQFRQTRIGSESYQKASFFFLDYRPEDPRDSTSPRTKGPYGLGAIIMSLCLPLAGGLAIGTYFTIRSDEVIKIRNDTQKLEQEFASGLFQLGNRLGDGLPTEIAFGKVSEVLRGTNTGRFFQIATDNISRLGMDVERAIFDPQNGALLEYPSSVIESSMKVLIESSRKGPQIASQAVISVSEYIKQMHRVDERLKDLMADVISSMRSQVSFLMPVIAGIVIGITAMISSILGTIAQKLTELTSATGDLSAAGGAGAIFEVFGAGGIATYHFQAIVGIYVVQITIILTIMVNGIENGTDSLMEEYELGKNLLRTTLIYVFTSAVTIVLFSIIASSISDI